MLVMMILLTLMMMLVMMVMMVMMTMVMVMLMMMAFIDTDDDAGDYCWSHDTEIHSFAADHTGNNNPSLLARLSSQCEFNLRLDHISAFLPKWISDKLSNIMSEISR